MKKLEYKILLEIHTGIVEPKNLEVAISSVLELFENYLKPLKINKAGCQLNVAKVERVGGEKEDTGAGSGKDEEWRTFRESLRRA